MYFKLLLHFLVVLHLHTIVAEESPCKQRVRQLKQELTGLTSGSRYLFSSFDCDVRIIFDTAYSGLFQKQQILDEKVDENAGVSGVKCVEEYKSNIKDTEKEPFDECYHGQSIQRYSKIQEFDDLRKDVDKICKNCKGLEDDCFLNTTKKIMKDGRDLYDYIFSGLNLVREKINVCVKDKMKVVEENFDRIAKHFEDCIHSV